MTARTTAARERAARGSVSVRVHLLWRPRQNTVTVSVENAPTDHCFETAAEPERALDAPYQPFAFAA